MAYTDKLCLVYVLFPAILWSGNILDRKNDAHGFQCHYYASSSLFGELHRGRHRDRARLGTRAGCSVGESPVAAAEGVGKTVSAST